MSIADIPLIVEEATGEIRAISNLQVVLAEEGLRSRVSASARQASSDAAILLMSATFEEAHRQLAREYMRTAFAAGKLDRRVIQDTRKRAWVSAGEKIKFNKFGVDKFDAGGAIKTLDAMRNFCLDGNFSEEYTDVMIFNKSNLRPGDIDSLYKSAGFEKFCERISRHSTFKSYFNVGDLKQAENEFKRQINEFVETRNRAMHDLSAHRAAGSVDISNTSELLIKTLERADRVLTQALI